MQSVRAPVTVAQVLELEDFVAAGIEVVAGARGLDREASWVHAAEISDIAGFLRGGEVLLTAGMGIGQQPQAQRRYMRALATAGASALVLELGRAFERAPAAVCEEAERTGLPVAVLHRDVPFAEVTRKVHAWIIGRRYELIERAEHIAVELNALLLAGGSVPQLMHKLHDLTGKTCLLEDAAHQLIEYAGHEQDLDRLLPGWSAHSRTGHARNGDGPVHVAEGATCAWADVAVRGEVWARLHVIESGEPDRLDEIAIERASAAIGLALLSDRHRARVVEDAHADLFAEVARRAPADTSAFLRQARSLGADYRGRELAVIAFCAAGADAARLADAALAQSRALGLPGLASANHDGAEGRMLLGVAPRGEDATPLQAVAAELLRIAPEDGEILVGISRPTAVATLPRAFEDAEECLRFARLTGRSGIYAYSDLGLHLLLSKLAEGRDLAAFVEAELGPLLDHDTRGRGELLATLRMLLETDNNKAEAARLLHLERRSIYYRLARIEAILGRSLDAYDARLALGVALRALDMIEERAASVRGARLASGTRS